jgi:glyceraldehyde-3-phosphate dehydrogenase (NAD(P))
MAKKGSFAKAGLDVAGSVEEMLRSADIIVDATPGGVGEQNKPIYEKIGVKAVFQGGEDHEVAGFSFCSDCNYKGAIGRQFVRVVSCNTTGLCRIINLVDQAFGVERVRSVMVRRGSDPGEVKKGPIDAVVLDPVGIPSHHGPDVITVLPHVRITTMAMIVPTTFMHMHAVQMDTKRDGNREDLLRRIEEHPRIGLVRSGTGIKSTAELKEYALDLGRPRGDLWESCVFAESLAVLGKEIYFFQAIHQEADVVVENVDAIRAMAGAVKDPMTSIRMTNDAMHLSAL